MIKSLIMEVDKRSRVWIVTFDQTDPITDDQLPDQCGEFVHAIQNNETGSCSVFMKFKTLQSTSTIQSLFTSHDTIVIKRTNWDKYEDFKRITTSSEVLRHGAAKHNDSDQDQSVRSKSCSSDRGTNLTNDESKTGYNTDDMVADVSRARTIKRQVDALSSEYAVIKKRIASWI
ncbi:MAG: hypothetical protein EHM22_00710 [Actinobacteria bacterium]|nr:MAG: hypothetical protein EHM22_02105 [Actinomycetota bacterium]RPJ15321.1 MAG: hypothetical protein EHM22_00710 [Actinomycetota bacterium]